MVTVSSHMPVGDASTSYSSNASLQRDDVRQALYTLPKAELHLHIEGTLEPELAFTLAKRNGVQLPWSSVQELHGEYEFTLLQSFLDLYYQLMSTLRTAEDFTDLAMAYFQKAHNHGVRHAEIFFDPQVHMRNGIAYETVLDGLLAALRQARERYGISSGLIMCIIRDLPVEDAEHLLDLAASRKDDLLGIGLDSAEVGYPPELFAGVYERARGMGLHVVAHAGEEGPAAYVRQALDVLHVERIDHGVHAADDPQLIERGAQEGIGMTSCPLSNRRLQVVQDLQELPLHELIAAGVPVSLNSDDPAYFGGYIGDNYAALYDAGYTVQELITCARNSIMTSFNSESEQQRYLDDIDQWQSTVGL